LGGSLVGRLYSIVGRNIDEAAQLGGVVSLGLTAAGPGDTLRGWD